MLETLPAAGGPPTTWTAPGADVSYFLAGWSSTLGIVLWEDQGGAGPSVENYGLPLGVVFAPGASVTVLGTVPVFQQPALALGADLALVVNGSASSGQGEGEKFVWFGKSLELCDASGSFSLMTLPEASVAEDPAISSLDGTLAFVVGPQSDADLPPVYSSGASWAQVSAWYTGCAVWIARSGSTSPREISGTRGAADPVFSQTSTALVFVKNQSIWLLPTAFAHPVAVAQSLERPSAPYLFGYVDWRNEFAWWS